MVSAFLNTMYRSNADFVFTVTRDFVRACQTPILVLPDDIPAHPYAVAMESASLAPKAEVSLYPWKESPEQIAQALHHICAFLKGTSTRESLHDIVKLSRKPHNRNKDSIVERYALSPHRGQLGVALRTLPDAEGLASRRPTNL